MNIVSEMINTAQLACKDLRDQISNVRFGPIIKNRGFIKFEFQGKSYLAPEPIDVIPVGNNESARSWALKQILNETAKPI